MKDYKELADALREWSVAVDSGELDGTEDGVLASDLMRAADALESLMEELESKHKKHEISGRWVYEELIFQLRSRAIRAIDRYNDRDMYKDFNNAADAIEELTKNKTGNWIKKNHDGSWRVETCSVCNMDTHYVRYAPSYKHCPNCGARMDGVME